jgi:hypothetical protein
LAYYFINAFDGWDRAQPISWKTRYSRGIGGDQSGAAIQKAEVRIHNPVSNQYHLEIKASGFAVYSQDVPDCFSPMMWLKHRTSPVRSSKSAARYRSDIVVSKDMAVVSVREGVCADFLLA